MKIDRVSPVLATVLIWLTIGLACASVAAPSPTAVRATYTASPTETPTKTPTSTPKPTATPNLQATQQAEELNSILQNFEEKGYITTADGESVRLSSFKEDWAQIESFRSWLYQDVLSDFLLKGHFKWSSAVSTSDPSGCGVIFGAQENGDYYVVFLDKAEIIFLMKRSATLYAVGKTRGPGRVNFSNPAEADVIVAVRGQRAYVSVDGEVTEYTLSADQTSTGRFGFSLLSGTNKDYGTRCEITDIILWTPE